MVLKQISRHKAVVGDMMKVILEDVVDVDVYSAKLGFTG